MNTTIALHNKTVQNCKKTMPLVEVGNGETQDAKEILQEAWEVYQNPEAKNQAGYAEFVQLFEQRLQEGHAYCGGKNIKNTEIPPQESKKDKTSKILKGLYAIVDLLAVDKKVRTQKIINGLEAIQDLF
jgi:hypothetical protein